MQQGNKDLLNSCWGKPAKLTVGHQQTTLVEERPDKVHNENVNYKKCSVEQAEAVHEFSLWKSASVRTAAILLDIGGPALQASALQAVVILLWLCPF